MKFIMKNLCQPQGMRVEPACTLPTKPEIPDIGLRKSSWSSSPLGSRAIRVKHLAILFRRVYDLRAELAELERPLRLPRSEVSGDRWEDRDRRRRTRPMETAASGAAALGMSSGKRRWFSAVPCKAIVEVSKSWGRAQKRTIAPMRSDRNGF